MFGRRKRNLAITAIGVACLFANLSADELPPPLSQESPPEPRAEFLDQPAANFAAEPPSGPLHQWLDDAGGGWLSDQRVNVAGFLEQGFTWNPDRPDDRRNGTVLFNDRANEYQMNLLYLTVARPVDRQRGDWDIGGEVDLAFGTLSRFLKVPGLELHSDGGERWNSEDRRFYHLAMPQLYAEAFAPIGNGLSVKVGHFFSPLGFEAYALEDLFFYSLNYLITFAEPYTFTGAIADYSLTENLRVRAGMTRGWDNFDDNNHDLGALAVVSWHSSDQRTMVAIGMHTGAEDAAGDNNRFLYTVFVRHRATDRLTLGLQHDFGFEDDAVPDGLGGAQNAEWYGLSQSATYRFNEQWAVGTRFDWFRDDDHARIVSAIGVPAFLAQGGNYFAFTAGANWTPRKGVTIRPEARWDWSNVSVPLLGFGGPFDDLGDKNQFLLATDVIIAF